MTEEDKEIQELRQRLTRLQDQKRKRKRLKRKTGRKRGRPPIDQAKLKQAKELAKDFPIPDVANMTGISLRTLYSHGIKRYKLDAEAAAARGGR